MAQQVLGAAGAVVGFFFGNPMAGYLAGSALGAALFPTKLPDVEGPRLSDLRVQSSSIGGLLPRVYGRYALAGNVIWATPLREVVTTEERSAKGGPTQKQTTYTYFATCAIGLCEGPITGILRVWADAKLVYDIRPQQPEETETELTARFLASADFAKYVTVYLGTETQLADPTIEAVEGVGNVSAYRGLAYIVLSEFPVEDFGNRLPSFRVEVATTPLTESSETVFARTLTFGNSRGLQDFFRAYLQRWNTDADPPLPAVPAPRLAFEIPGEDVPPETAVPWPTQAAAQAALEAWRGYAVAYRGWSYDLAGAPLRPHSGQPDFRPLFPGVEQAETGITLHYNRFAGIPNGTLGPARADEANEAAFRDYFESLGLVIGDSGHSPNAYIDGSFGYGVWVVTDLLDPPPGSGPWTSLTLDLDADTVADAMLHCYPDDFVNMLPGVQRTAMEPASVSIAAIVTAECARVGVTEIDVSELESETIQGLMITRPLSARDIIAGLRPIAMFDAVESGEVLRFVKRGGAPVATLTEDELAVHAVTSEIPARYEIERTQDVELPREMRVRYARPHFDFEPGEQKAQRLTKPNGTVQETELPVAMSDDRARQVADVLLWDAWASRRRTPVRLGRARLLLEPTDVVLVPVAGQLERMRVIEDVRGNTGLLNLALVSDDEPVYQSTAVGGSASSRPGGLGLRAPATDLVLLDLPPLRDQDNNAGYYVATRPMAADTWRGAIITRSSDGGARFESVVTVATPATMADVIASLPSADFTVEDTTSVLRLAPLQGDFESATPAAIDGGANVLAVGAPGRWEILQFRTATKISDDEWQLTDLLRGRRGTEHAIGTSAAGDVAVLLTAGGVARVPLDTVEIGGDRPHRAVTVGTAVEDAETVDFIPRGVALRPWAPIDLSGSRDGGGDLTVTWTRRDRFGPEVPTGPLRMSEAVELYDVAIMDGSTEVRVIQVTTPTVVYTAADQTADFGTPQASVDVIVYQRSAVVGRGYPAAASV